MTRTEALSIVEKGEAIKITFSTSRSTIKSESVFHISINKYLGCLFAFFNLNGVDRVHAVKITDDQLHSFVCRNFAE